MCGYPMAGYLNSKDEKDACTAQRIHECQTFMIMIITFVFVFSRLSDSISETIYENIYNIEWTVERNAFTYKVQQSSTINQH